MSHVVSERYAKLLKEFETNQAELKTLTSKDGESFTQEDALRCTALQTEMQLQAEGLKSEQTRINAAKVAGGFDDFLNTPVTALPQAKPGQAQALGFGDAGEVTIDANGKQWDDSTGFTAKQYRAMRSPVYKSAMESYIRRAGVKDFMSDGEFKTLQEGADTAGGFTVFEDIYNGIVEKEPTPTRVDGYVMQITTSTDAKTLPKVNYSTDNIYTTGMRVTWTGEVPASSAAARVTEPVFGSIRIPVYTAMMSLPITRDLLEDSAFDLNGWIVKKFRETVRILYDDMILNGTGVGQPSGILVNPNATNNPTVINTGQAATLTADSIINLAEDLPEQYDESCRYIFNKTNTGKAMRTLKDGEGRYIFAKTAADMPGSLVAGRPESCNGYPYTFSGLMPNVGASTYPMIFGDPTGYYKVNRIGFTIQVLNELYAESNYIVLLGRIRFGGCVAEDWKLRILRCHT